MTYCNETINKKQTRRRKRQNYLHIICRKAHKKNFPGIFLLNDY